MMKTTIRRFSIVLYRDTPRQKAVSVLYKHLAMYSVGLASFVYISRPLEEIHYLGMCGFTAMNIALMTISYRACAKTVEEILYDDKKIILKFPFSQRSIEQKDIDLEFSSPAKDDLRPYKIVNANGEFLISTSGTVINKELFEKFFGKLN